MKIFQCLSCSHTVYFESKFCEKCGVELGFDAATLQMVPVSAHGENFEFCSNAQQNVCNWLIPSAQAPGLCTACELNRYIPNLQDLSELDAWQSLEYAKHRLLYSLYRLGLPIESKQQNPEQGLSFDFVNTEAALPSDVADTTGHDQGQITVLTQEADNVHREKTRRDLNESYRTVLGHFRHEIGHYYWDILIKDNAGWLNEYRNFFGDERLDYQTAMSKHYSQGPQDDWSQFFVSAYASSHPWEDWAETWAHYLHLIDTLETAVSLGVTIEPNQADNTSGMNRQQDPYIDLETNSLDDWLVPAVNLTLALNSLNRSMGMPDTYPFLLNDVVRTKLGFIHKVIQSSRSIG